MKLIDTRHAAGHVLCHDLTRIIPGVTKDAAFRKGHIVTEEDIPILLSMGKDHLYVWEKTPGMLHEDEAAEKLRALAQNQHMNASLPKEGKIELTAAIHGLFRVDIERLFAVNSVEDVMIATRHTNTVVMPGDKLAGMRVIPLVISGERIQAAEQAAGDKPLLELLPFVRKTAAVITTGTEVSENRIKDQFTPVILDKLSAFDVKVISKVKVADDRGQIIAAIHEAHSAGAELILCTGGMSVDPDDRTPGAIKAAGVNVITYGAPVLPGAMFLLGEFPDGTPVMGLPGCVMYAKTTIFDIVLPRVLCGCPVNRADLVRLGHGGLCLGCGECRYPICPFCKET